MVDSYNKYEQNKPILFWNIATNVKFKKNIAINTQISHRAKLYYTFISNTWHLITVPNMNKINPFFWERSQQTLKIYEKIAIITQFSTEPNSILHASARNGIWLLYQIWINQPIFLWDITSNTPNVWKSDHIYSNLAQSNILLYKHE